MTYTYGTHGSPAVGGGLPGLPQRQSEKPNTIPYGSLVYAPKVAPSGVLNFGAQYSREAYPEVEKLFPLGSFPNMLNRHVATAAMSPGSFGLDVSPNNDGSHVAMAMSSPTGTVRVFQRDSEGLLSSWVVLTCSGAAAAATSASFSPDGNFLFVVLSGGTAALRVFARDGNSYAEVAVPAVNIAGSGSPNVSAGHSPTGSGYTVLVNRTDFASVYRFTGTEFQLVQSLATNGLVLPGYASTLVSPDGYFLALKINGVDATRIYRWGSSSYTLQSLTLPINSIYFGKYVFSPESDVLYCVAVEGTYGGIVALDLSKTSGASNPRTISTASLGVMIDAVPLPSGFVLAASQSLDRWRLLKVTSSAITQIAAGASSIPAPEQGTLRASADGGHLFARGGTSNSSALRDYGDATKFDVFLVQGVHFLAAGD